MGQANAARANAEYLAQIGGRLFIFGVPGVVLAALYSVIRYLRVMGWIDSFSSLETIGWEATVAAVATVGILCTVLGLACLKASSAKGE